MISPGLLLPGSLDQARPTSLVLPRSKYDEAFLVGTIEGLPAALFLEGERAFRWFPSADAHNWEGVIIPDVRLDIDHTKIADLDRGKFPGLMIRSGTTLTLCVMSENRMSRALVTVMEGLPDAGNAKAGFTDWQIVIGDKSEKQVLWRHTASH